ncbi:MAG: J domain-containing protein [Bacillati bacterium ANGP1]|uniref:J domain-containing protein n=1 Tax=Candidatus Segetimicrobium genomatis TaxID=2569760 RepID=A0A537IWT3_9BACT|nr:MAG: J domain-containing protein [Terrabacteria group bacterium ANGP1]
MTLAEGAQMRTALVGFLACVAILALSGVIPPPASPAGMVFLVAVDASDKVYTTYGNYSTAEACNAALKATPAPGRGLHLECRDLGGRSIPPSAMALVAYALAFLLGPTKEALGSAVTLAVITLRGPLATHPDFWRLTQNASSVLTGGQTVWVGKWLFSSFGYQPTLLILVVIGAAFIVGAVRGRRRTPELPRARARQTRKSGNFPSDVNYYEVLQVHPTADVAVIKSAYRTIMRELQAHPDLGGDEEKAKIVNEAHRVLSAPDLRTEYDAFRRAYKVVDNSFLAEATMGVSAAIHVAAPTAATQQADARNGSWGYAGLPFIYLIAHRAWWHLLANLTGSMIPMVNVGVYLWYVFNVRRLVQSTRKFESFDQYRAVQQAWDKAGKWVLALGLLIVIVRIFRPLGL